MTTRDHFKTVVAVVTAANFLIAPAIGQSAASKDTARVEGPRDRNMFKVEPTIVDERHYSYAWDIPPNSFKYDADSRSLVRAKR